MSTLAMAIIEVHDTDGNRRNWWHMEGKCLSGRSERCKYLAK